MMNYSSALLSSMTASALQAAAAAASMQNSAPSVKRTEVPGLPRGWFREESYPNLYNFHNGAINGTGKPEVVYYSPRGHKVTTKSEMARILGDAYDLTAFDFQTGKINPNLLARRSSQNYHSSNRASSGHSSSASVTVKSSRPAPVAAKESHQTNGGTNSTQKSTATVSRTDNSLVPPIRQTASIFKQPVTVKKNSQHQEDEASTKAKADLKASNAEKPRQLFWEKRLSGLRASYPNEVYEPVNLPKNFKPVGPGIGTDVVLASISTSLHMCSGEVKGQTVSKNQAGLDPAVYLAPEQPLIHATKISQDDIEMQEARVVALRKKLAQELSAISS